MKPFLMYADRPFEIDESDALPAGADALSTDLGLPALWQAAAQSDSTIAAVMRTSMLTPLTSPDEICFRLDVLDDCTRNRVVVGSLYQLVRELLDKDQDIFRASYFRLTSETMLDRAARGMSVFLTNLRALRRIADENAEDFTSQGFTTLFDTIRHDLNDRFFDAAEEHLQMLRFRQGPLATARLGHLNQGVDYTLRIPHARNRSKILRRPPVGSPHFTRTIPRDDEAGHQELAELRNRILGVAAVAVAESVEHLKVFFTALHVELGFYVGCLNLRARIEETGSPVCRPVPYAVGTGRLAAESLYNPCLSVHGTTPNRSNDLRADGKTLVFMTGANQGGKSTFLRAIGIAHLMMQCGMFVCAQSFAASAADGVLSHFTREEDPSRSTGKFDEAMERMSDIARNLRPGALILCNESFASTNEREGVLIATEVLQALTQCGVSVVFVTHLYELAHQFYERGDSTALFLRAERTEDGRRSFRLREGEPLATSFAEDLFSRMTDGSKPSSLPAT